MKSIDDKLDRFFLLGWLEDAGTFTTKEVREVKRLRKEFKSALKLQELVKAHREPKCECEYGNCEHSICEQLVTESEK